MHKPNKTCGSYLQISHLEGPDLLFGFHFPNFNHAAHVARSHQGGVVAEHGARHGVFVTCRDEKRKRNILHVLDAKLRTDKSYFYDLI